MRDSASLCGGLRLLTWALIAGRANAKCRRFCEERPAPAPYASRNVFVFAGETTLFARVCNVVHAELPAESRRSRFTLDDRKPVWEIYFFRRSAASVAERALHVVHFF
eukprot:TRINITY_DN1355_c0_g2_i1.p1 TRINITY_DN1355_c0_g2~~TRINITY_DN1355_c0_g2_i1.p1  ORF type:complete len:108 (+),score=5.26 TRINITY_DN1355_c0_g2_i1:203-526(+)